MLNVVSYNGYRDRGQGIGLYTGNISSHASRRKARGSLYRDSRYVSAVSLRESLGVLPFRGYFRFFRFWALSLP